MGERDSRAKESKKKRRSRSREDDRHKRKRSRSRSTDRRRGDERKRSRSPKKDRRRSRSRDRDRDDRRDRSRSRDRERDRDRDDRKERERSRRDKEERSSRRDKDKEERRSREKDASRDRKHRSKSPESKRRKEEKKARKEDKKQQQRERTSGMVGDDTSGEESTAFSVSSAPIKVEAAAATTSTKSSFGGLALKKKDKAKTETPPAPAPSTSAATSAATSSSTSTPSTAVDDKDAIERRQERLRLWREQQKQKLENAEETAKPPPPPLPPIVALEAPVLKGKHGGFVMEEEEVKKVHMWPIDERDEKEDSSVTTDVSEVDPLDAFMADLSTKGANDIEQKNLDIPKAKVISFEEIMAKNKEVDFYGTFLPPDNKKLPPSIYPPKTEETEEEREAREKAELEEFMKAIKAKREREEKINKEGIVALDDEDSSAPVVEKKQETGRIYQGVEEDAIGEEMAIEVESKTALEVLMEAQKKKEIKPVDHSTIDYIPFRKKFYIEPTEIANLTEEEASKLLVDMEIKTRGKGCPRPILKWTHTGLSQRLLKLIARQQYQAPFAIQCQALPAIMSGRDVIGIAKTGSGKTLAFLLPMFRHILDQPPLSDGEGPIGLIMAPCRELVQQIYMESKKFAKDLGLRSTAIYGGSSVSEQIANLKRGSDIVICTPGRMIEILTMSSGKMVSLKRVTYVVLDEADRMFDMGFEPQITKIMMNIRPDKQTLLFSATFPHAVESLARRVLKRPIEITVGARSTASGDITQFAEVREESDKFMRLLQLLGIWYEKGNILVFVNTQQACDQVFQDLMKAGYMALSLHGGKDQVDRDYTIDDFKRKVRTLMVATSVAGRGLDVKDLVLVINYHCPNHLEDYVHRVGRTGRAGRKGTAYTFISPQEEEYAPDLVKALENAKQEVPQELRALSDSFKEKVRSGLARYHGSGFRGKGFTFDESEKSEAQRAADVQKRQYEIDEGLIDFGGDEEVDEDRPSKPTTSSDATTTDNKSTADAMSMADKMLSFKEKARLVADSLFGDPAQEGFFFRDELEINDYPQQARWKVTQKESSDLVAELTGAAVYSRGTYLPPGRKPNPGERKLYLAIEGSSRQSVQDAKRELQRILDEKTLEVGIDDRKYGKYSI